MPIRGLNQRWQAWQLAPDEATYGRDAGRYVIVTEDGEHELPFGVMDEEDALLVVEAHNHLLLWNGIEQARDEAEYRFMVRAGVIR